jgi:hypothetical protein
VASLKQFQRRFLSSVDHMAIVCEWMTVISLAMIAGLLWGISQHKLPLSVPVIRLSASQFAISQEHLGKVPTQTPLTIYRKGKKNTFILQDVTVYQNDKMMLTVLPVFSSEPEIHPNTARYVSYRLEVGRTRLFNIIFPKKKAVQ